MKPETLEQFLRDMLRGMTHLHIKAQYYANTDAHSLLYTVYDELPEGINYEERE